jgi:hypothetical protein
MPIADASITELDGSGTGTGDAVTTPIEATDDANSSERNATIAPATGQAAAHDTTAAVTAALCRSNRRMPRWAPLRAT